MGVASHESVGLGSPIMWVHASYYDVHAGMGANLQDGLIQYHPCFKEVQLLQSLASSPLTGRWGGMCLHRCSCCSCCRVQAMHSLASTCDHRVAVGGSGRR